MSSHAPTCLHTEHLESPLGIGERQPRLSWLLPAGTISQQAYRVRTGDGQDSDWVDGDHSLLVPWPFEPLGSGQAVGWQVQVRTDAGTSPWSAVSTLETGLLDPSDWSASWIHPSEEDVPPGGRRPVHELQTTIRLTGPVRRARLYATAHGLYEVFLGGVRVGDEELTPGYTEYGSRVQVQSYDVTDLLVPGDNTVTALLSDGWYRGQVGVMRATEQWGDRTAFLAQLHVELSDGETVVHGTDWSWVSRPTAGTADLIAGQTIDLGATPADWHPVIPANLGTATLVWSPAPPVRRVQELRPVAVRRLDDDRQVVDLGQNINGWVRLTDLGPAGSEVVLTHGEWLSPDGDVTTDHLRPAMAFLPEMLSAGQVDRVVSAGDGRAFEPRHTTHGFQYVRVEGHPHHLTVDDVTGVVVHTDLRRRGWFTCSDDRIQRLHEAALWSFRGNACDIPTDCPTRERHGWTGDWQLYVPTASFLYDVAGMSTKWLRDLAVGQWDNGIIGNMAPMPRAEGREGPIAHWNGSSGWGDAVVAVPWETYLATGDERILAELWPAMVRWLAFVENTAAEARHPDRVTRSITPAAHEHRLWDTGFHWGEWLEPGQDLSDMRAYLATDKADVATAWFARSAGLMAAVAGVLGRAADADRYAALAEEVRSAWQTEFVSPDGVIHPDTQATLVRALSFDLVPHEHRQRTADRLAELVRAAGTHLGTGFLATPDLLPVLVDHGYADVAYELLLQDTPPSWLTMLDRGATTVWERWDGVDADGVPQDSLNHYSKGAVISFLHRYTAGIRPGNGPAYKSFIVRPVPGGGLTSASAVHESPYGRIRSAWHQTEDTFTLDVTVPSGTTATVILPDGSRREMSPGSSTFTCSPGRAA